MSGPGTTAVTASPRAGLIGGHESIRRHRSHAISGFRIEAHGSLTPAGSLPGIVAGAAGLAAR